MYQFEENYDVNLQAKNQIHPSWFPWDIAKTLQNKLVVLGTLTMPRYAHPKWYYALAKRVLWACLVSHTQNDSNNL